MRKNKAFDGPTPGEERTQYHASSPGHVATGRTPNPTDVQRTRLLCEENSKRAPIVPALPLHLSQAPYPPTSLTERNSRLTSAETGGSEGFSRVHHLCAHRGNSFTGSQTARPSNTNPIRVPRGLMRTAPQSSKISSQASPRCWAKLSGTAQGSLADARRKKNEGRLESPKLLREGHATFKPMTRTSLYTREKPPAQECQQKVVHLEQHLSTLRARATALKDVAPVSKVREGVTVLLEEGCILGEQCSILEEMHANPSSPRNAIRLNAILDSKIQFYSTLRASLTPPQT